MGMLTPGIMSELSDGDHLVINQGKTLWSKRRALDAKTEDGEGIARANRRDFLLPIYPKAQ